MRVTSVNMSEFAVIDVYPAARRWRRTMSAEAPGCGRPAPRLLDETGEQVLVIDRADDLAAQASQLGFLVVKGDAGVDEAFGRPADYLKMKIGSGPYYLVEQKPRFATTMGGLVVNTSLQVLNENDTAISGLYAAGEVVGGVMGDDSPSGANNGWALTSGKLAAEAIAAAN